MTEIGANTRNDTRFTLLLLGLVAIMILFTEAMIIPALPTIQSQFDTTPAWAAWIVSIYLLVGAVATPIFGKLGDTYGKKKFFLICMTFYTIGVIGNGVTWNLSSLLVFRAIQGIGLAIFPLAFAIIRDEFPHDKVATATGIVSAMFGVGAAIGLVVGAWISDNYGWQTTYHTAIPFAIILTLLAAYKLKESPIRTPSKVDILGAMTFSVALISLLIVMTEGQTWGWTSLSILSLFGVGITFIMLFLVIESRITDPMIDPAMMRKRNVFFTNIIAFIAGLCQFLVFQSVITSYRRLHPSAVVAPFFKQDLCWRPERFSCSSWHR